MITCDPWTSVVVAPARRAMRRTTSLPAASSPVGTTAQDGRLFHAGTPVGSLEARAETGRCVTAITRACSPVESAAKASWNPSGSITNSTPGSVPSPVG